MTAVNYGLQGKNVLVTGAGTGIGREIALEFARHGANIVLHHFREEAGAVSAADAARRLGVRAEVVPADFSDLAGVQRLASAARTALGRVDVLVNNAGITFNKPFLQVTPEQYEKLYAVNVRAGFFLAQQVVPDMIAGGGGAICNLSSIHGLQGVPEHAVYAGTKGAIIAATRALAVELGHRGIRVNAIAPGCIPVENYAVAAKGYSLSAAAAWAKNAIPAARYGTPLEVARLAVFLCSDAAAFILGQTIVIDGGTAAMMSLVSDFRTESTARFGENYL
ncbi:MAG TPA: glucose 1-dehydrogenase [Gemmatimonadaceae bacterium]|nr:glucose 1-dehydrogenase [Gemmatimonadaceae bacterium]